MVKLKKNRVDLMKAEKNALKFNAIVNFIVVLIKIIGGNILGFAALIADGFYTVSDFITDILAIIGSKVGNKRPNKRYPLGYGNFENIMQMIMGFMIFLVGIVVIVMSFNIHYQKPSLLVLIPLVIVILLKTYSSNLLLEVGKKVNSSLLINSSKESFVDVTSSVVLIGVVILGQFIPGIDMIASVFLGFGIIYQAFKMIYENGLLLIGESVNNQKIEAVLEDVFKNYRKISLVKSTIIKHGSFYHLILNIKIKKDYSVKSLILAEEKIKKEIKSRRLKISYIDFDIST